MKGIAGTGVLTIPYAFYTVGMNGKTTTRRSD